MSKCVNVPHLPEGKVGLIAIGEKYLERLGRALGARGIEVIWLPDARDVDARLAGHADLSLLHLGGNRLVSACGDAVSDALSSLGFELLRVSAPGRAYPDDCVLNACIVGKRFIHRLDITEPAVLHNLEGFELVNVAQGYTKCCTCVVDENSVITSDHGIAIFARRAGLDVLEISPGHIELEGFDYGFIGGATFKLSNSELAFTGRIDRHPDFGRIIGFLSERKIEAVYLTDGPAFDIGSAVLLKEC